MASTSRLSHARFRRVIVLGAVAAVSGGGLLALEHASTGATTGTPSHYGTTSTTKTTKYVTTTSAKDNHCESSGQDDGQFECRPASGDD